MIKAIALDDESLALQVIENFCSRVEDIELVKTFTQSSEAKKFLMKYPVDLIFLDINMPAISGVDFYKAVNEYTAVIFTTAYSEYAVEGFDLNAIDYLLKPIKFDRFEKAIARAKERLQQPATNNTRNKLIIRADYSLHQIEYQDICYIEAMSDYLRIHLTDAKPVVTRMTMKNMEEKLPSDTFVRVHRSYFVSIDKIESVKKSSLQISGTEIPVSKGYKSRLDELWEL
ncbi:LytTR family DNA-binding domain-containing protein [Limibacter armeniacum]|uniref:LytR/AlgR family response regulator transcription factor n=1 Tax=Limibacter armeniacum TaxID=466084 RepID=UPI002FE50B79